MKASIVIPNFNGRQLLEKHLPKVVAAAGKAEVIVVDDASTDDSVAFLKKGYPQVRLIQHQTNRRFAAACNTGVTQAKGRVVVLLNNDVSPEKGLIAPLMRHFEDSNTFAVGCREIERQNGREVISGRTACAFRRGFLVHWRPKDQESEDTCWTFGGSMAVDREKYLRLGGMDELFAPAYWEDIDLSWRAKKRGWQVVFEHKAVVHHHHESTNPQELGRVRMKLYAYRNQILFSWKHLSGRQVWSHLLWLPYHLTVTTVKTKGLFFLALCLAIWRRLTYET
jgi:GT2 family glycosyltransferase